MIFNYYIKAASLLRDKYNQEKIHSQLNCLFNQQIYYDFIYTESQDSENNFEQIQFYDPETNKLTGLVILIKEFEFLIKNIQKIDEFYKNVDNLVDSLLNMSFPGGEEYQFSSFSQNTTGDEPNKNLYIYNDDTAFDLYIRLIKPENLNKILIEPVKVSMNMLQINEEGFLKDPQISMINNIQNSLKMLNIQIEVNKLNINIFFEKQDYFKQSRQMFDMRFDKQEFIQNYMNYVKINKMETEWIYTKQKLFVNLEFSDYQSQALKQHISEEQILSFRQARQFDAQDYQVKISLKKQLNEVTLNNTLIGLQNKQPDNYIKQVIYTNEVNSNLIRFLGNNNNIASVRISSLKNCEYLQYDTLQLNKAHNQIVFFGENNSNNQFKVSLFDIYKDLLEHHFTKQTFMFQLKYDFFNKIDLFAQRQNYQLSVNQLLHKKASIILSIKAFKNLVSHIIHFKPDQMLWDLYI